MEPLEQPMKGGHLPAMKVGKVRIPQTRSRGGQNEDSSPPMIGQQDTIISVDPQLRRKSNPNVVVSGAQTSEEKAFPKEAIRDFHVKPRPSIEKIACNPKPKILHQPMKL